MENLDENFERSYQHLLTGKSVLVSSKFQDVYIAFLLKKGIAIKLNTVDLIHTEIRLAETPAKDMVVEEIVTTSDEPPLLKEIIDKALEKLEQKDNSIPTPETMQRMIKEYWERKSDPRNDLREGIPLLEALQLLDSTESITNVVKCFRRKKVEVDGIEFTFMFDIHPSNYHNMTLIVSTNAYPVFKEDFNFWHGPNLVDMQEKGLNVAKKFVKTLKDMNKELYIQGYE